MASLKKVGVVAALAGMLFVGHSSIALAQQPDEAAELNKRVMELYGAGRYADAIPIAQRALAIRERTLGRDHPDVSQSLNNLALLYESQGRYGDAEPMYQRALAIREKAFGRDDPRVATSQALLADDEALLVFDFDDTSYAWIITRTDADWTELKISGRVLAAQVRALRAAMTDPRQRFDPALAYRIYRATFGAFADRIAAKKRLSIITNGGLTSLPPQLLVTKDPSGKTLKQVDWLVRSHAITILPSVASLKVLRGGSQASAARKPMIAFADPVFSKAARARVQQVAMRSITSFYRGTQVDIAAIGEHLPQLPGTRKEVTEIARELKAASEDIRLGLAATETAVKQAKLDQYRIVYFATHGLVSGELEPFAKSKAEPALALTIPDLPNDFDDGLLTASEVAQLKLDADWVVLSACNTAAEEKPGAEALSGLARAFFYAGARSLIVSHWAVSDEATARLMVSTFRARARDPKLSHAEVLRQAMLAMIDAAPSDDHASPRFWAPFVVVGEPAKPRS